MVKLSGKSLGTGAFARVVKATLSRPNVAPVEVAVKIINKIRAFSTATVNLQAELDICAELDHPAIINTYGAYEDDESLFIVMELADKGELFKYTQVVGLEDMPLVAPNFIAEAILGLEYMASKGFVHRDIKPDNLLLAEGYHVKVADFGTVCPVESPLNTFTGTATYVSPEMLTTSKASATSDIWALGCVLFHLFVGRPPFKGETEHLVLEAVKARHIEWPPAEYFPPVARDLVERMLDMDPAQRIGARGYDEIKQHPFFAKIDWATCLQKTNETYLNMNYTELYRSHLLPNERVVYAGLVTKRRYKGFSNKERVLVLTDYPQLFYLDPQATNLKRGNVKWDHELAAQADNDKLFHVHTSEREMGGLPRVYHFEDAQGRANLWSAKINHLLKLKTKSDSPRKR
jgi:serine/threonine protein kinase